MTSGHSVEAPIVTSLGPAGPRTQTEHLRLLCDRWRSRRGAMLGRSFQFPDPGHLAVPNARCDALGVRPLVPLGG